jgi:rod shape determining protein RodA
LSIPLPRPLADQSWQAISITAALASVGGLTLFSVAGGSMSPWAANHTIRFLLFLAVAIGISYIPVRVYKPLVYPALAGSLFVLVAVLLLGAIKGGARSWLDLGFMQLQPSELVKIALLAVLARFFEMVPPAEMRSVRALWPPVAMIAVPFLLIAAQPDLGTGSLLLLSAIIICFLAGFPLSWFVGAGLVTATMIPLIYNFLLLPHQQERLTIFLNPQVDPLGAGYHVSQSLIAIGSGGINGKGWLSGSQSHLQYLPETETDFIFSAIAEEWGLIGGVVVIMLFGMLIRWGMKVAREAPGRFEKLLAGGLINSLFLYIAINLMMVIGLAPVVGIPLPLVSYGGSSMMAAMLSVGLLMGIDRTNRRSPTDIYA